MRDALKLALEALENSVDLVREDAYEAEKLYGNYPTRQGKVNGLKVLADDHEKAITSLREALAEDALQRLSDIHQEMEQQPVTWSDYEPDGMHHNKPSHQPVAYIGMILKEHFEDVCRKANGNSNTPLYAALPAQKPVAWWHQKSDTFTSGSLVSNFTEWKPLYTSPPQRTWVGLTDEDFAEACQMAERGNYLVAFQRIQAKLKEENT